MDVGHDVNPVDLETSALGHAKRDVQDGAVLRDVDVLAREHRVTAFGHARFLSQLYQEGQGLVRDEVLGEVEVPADRVDAEPGPSVRVDVENIAQMARFHGATMGDESVPGRAIG
jgi:hypothetical protein